MRVSIILAVLIAFPVAGFADVLHVPSEYPTIQQAIDAAVSGDTVLVAPGTYVENIVINGKGITVKSEQGPHITVIDGIEQVNSTAQVYHEDAVLDGFTITNGSGNQHAGNIRGGGIKTKRGTIQNNIIINNRAEEGGGIYSSSATIINNVVHGNEAIDDGGGIYIWNGLCADNTISCNKASGRGGGISCGTTSGCNPTISNNIIIDNTAREGGGIDCYTTPTIVNNYIADNAALEDGGGIRQRYTGILENNIIAGNRASNGGGIFGEFTNPQISNNVIVNNKAALMGGGLYSIKAAKFHNTIFWGNKAATGPEISICGIGSVLFLKHCDVMGGSSSIFINRGSWLNWGDGMVDFDPCFVDPQTNDYHLLYTSPCRDVGDASRTTQMQDFEGDPRIAYQDIDLGADEFHPHLYFIGDAVPTKELIVKVIGLPAQEAHILIGTDILDPPHNTPQGLFFLKPPLWILIAGTIPQNGLLQFDTRIPAGCPAPWEFPMQALVGDTLTPLVVLIVSQV